MNTIPSVHVVFPDEYPELLEHIGRVVATKLLEYGIQSENIQQATFDITESIRNEVGGTMQYIPRGQNYIMNKRDTEIFGKFKGDNYDQLAHEYSMTSMSIRNIVKRGLAREKALRQSPLF